MDSLTYLAIGAGYSLGHHRSSFIAFHLLVGYFGCPHIPVVSEFQEGKLQGKNAYQVCDPPTFPHVPLDKTSHMAKLRGQV